MKRRGNWSNKEGGERERGGNYLCTVQDASFLSGSGPISGVKISAPQFGKKFPIADVLRYRMSKNEPTNNYQSDGLMELLRLHSSCPHGFSSLIAEILLGVPGSCIGHIK